MNEKDIVNKSLNLIGGLVEPEVWIEFERMPYDETTGSIQFLCPIKSELRMFLEDKCLVFEYLM